MAKNRYTLYLTDSTRRIIESLERREYRVRDVLNAGVVLFDQADIGTRGAAMAVAHGMLKEDIGVALRRLKDTLDWMDSIKNSDAFSAQDRALAESLRRMLKDVSHTLERDLESPAQVALIREDKTPRKSSAKPVKSGKSAG